MVGRPIGTLLERADVTERALVHAAHVGIQRPVERHAPDAVQSDLAGLFPILDAHDRIIEQTFVSVGSVAILAALICVDDELPPSTHAPESGAA
jgi:hypothetical protein